MIYRDFGPLRMLAAVNKYRLIYADPPWAFRDKSNAGKRGAAHKYSTMGYREIARLPIPEIVDPVGCLLAMWWVPTQDREARYVAEAWGFKVRTMFGFVWTKRAANGRYAWGMGNYTRANAEACLIATIGRVPRASAAVHSVIDAPRGAHSAKPPETRSRLVQLVGDVSRIELFARQDISGWDVLGDEIGGAP